MSYTPDTPIRDQKKQPEQATEPNVHNPNREKLPEERFFDRSVYGGISYAAQAGTGIILTHFLKYGKGKPAFEKVATWLGSKVMPSKTGAEAIKSLSPFMMVTTMIMVGNTFLLPVKWLENRKAKIVRDWAENDIRKMADAGMPYSPEELAHKEKCLADLDKEPVQNWKSLLGGRAFGLGAVYATLFAMGKRNDMAEEYSAKVITKGLDRIGAKQLAKSKTLEQYIHVGFLDVFYSMVSAGGLYVYSHIINPPKGHKLGLHDLQIGPTPATPAISALAASDDEHEAPGKAYTDTIKPREAAAPRPKAKIEPAPKSYGQKINNEEFARNEGKLETASI